jgi:hypothetical protein
MVESERIKVWETYRQPMLQQYYLGNLGNSIPEASQVLEGEPAATVRQLAATLGGGCFTREADVILLRELLMRIQRHWTDITSGDDSHPSCPISISDDELNRHRADGRC